MDQFKRYDGYNLYISQQFIDQKLPICPFCKSDHPHWLLDSRDDGRTYYQCECCHGTISSDVINTERNSGPREPINVFMRIEELGTVCTDETLLGKAFPVTFFQKMAVPSTVFCPRCGKPQNRNNAFCCACGLRLLPPVRRRPAPPDRQPPLMTPPKDRRTDAPVPPRPRPAPVTEPAVEIPTPAPVTEPAVEAPTPAPVTEPAVEAPTPAPVTESAVEAPTPAPVVQPRLDLPQEPDPPIRFSIAPTILLSLATLYVFFTVIGTFISSASWPTIINGVLSFSPYIAMVTGLAVCRKKRNILFGIAFLGMGILELTMSMLVFLFVVPLQHVDSAIIVQMIFRLFNVIPFLVIGTSYLVAKPFMRILKLISAILILLFSFIGVEIISFSLSGGNVLLSHIFGTVLPVVAAIIYTPFKRTRK